MPALVRKALATPRLRSHWEVWLAVTTAAGFLALLVADVLHPLVVVALEAFLLF